MYVEGVGQKSGPCTATFNDLLCFTQTHAQRDLISLISVFQNKEKRLKKPSLHHRKRTASLLEAQPVNSV
jgi:hypothetical protein